MDDYSDSDNTVTKPFCQALCSMSDSGSDSGSGYYPLAIR